MKLRVTSQDVLKLLPGQKNILEEFWNPEIGDWCYHQKTGMIRLVGPEELLKVRGKKHEFIFLPNIGQMIDMMQKLKDYSPEPVWGYSHNFVLRNWSPHDCWELEFKRLFGGSCWKKNCTDKNLCDVVFGALKILLTQACEYLLGGCTDETMKSDSKEGMDLKTGKYQSSGA